MDPELEELIAAWLGVPIADDRREALLHRLRTDAEFRAAFVAEVRLLGMLKVVRAAPPRWLRLEDVIGWSSTDEETGKTRKTELADAVADCPRSVIVEQVRNGVRVRMAILATALGKAR